MARPLRVVFLTGGDDPSTRNSIEAICRLPDIQPLAIFEDDGLAAPRRLKNFRNNIRREGLAYPVYRILATLRRLTDRLVESAVVDRSRVKAVLREAFPDRSFSFDDIAARYSVPVVHVPNLNGPEAVSRLTAFDADLGIVLGTRVLRKNIFSVPAMGCINLHKGRVPDYRGLPPGFWEVFEGAPEAGVTVHFVDSGLDTGDVIGTSTVPIGPLDTPDTVLQKLHMEGTRVLAEAVASIQRGEVCRTAQPRSTHKTRTRPSRAQIAQLRARLPHWRRRGDVAAIAKNIYMLAVYRLGIYAAVRAWHRAQGSRAAILLHHRVNDYAEDVLTTSAEALAAQLLALRARYPAIDTRSIVDAVAAAKPIPPTSIAIHFDDCYREVWTNGAPILKTVGFPAAFFVNPGFIGTDRIFPHDQKKYAFRFENISADELRAWSSAGFEVCAHTVNHVDLGTCPLDVAEAEIVDSGRQLEQILGKPVTLFSFPFGSVRNIRRETAELVMKSQYEALFSAHGGFVRPATSLSDIPRIGCSGKTEPLYLLLEIEGLAPAQIARTLLRR